MVGVPQAWVRGGFGGVERGNLGVRTTPLDATSGPPFDGVGAGYPMSLLAVAGLRSWAVWSNGECGGSSLWDEGVA